MNQLTFASRIDVLSVLGVVIEAAHPNRLLILWMTIVLSVSYRPIYFHGSLSDISLSVRASTSCHG